MTVPLSTSTSLPAAAVITRAFHDECLWSYVRPSAVIATKPSQDFETFSYGDEADLRHNVWLLRTADPTKKRQPERVLTFDQVVDKGRVMLSSDRHLHDLLTFKVLTLELLRGQYISVGSSAHRIVAIIGACAWLVRWRASLQVATFQEIQRPHFEDFCIRLKGGAAGLIPWEQRLSNFREAVEKGNAVWPTHTAARSPYPRNLIDVGAVIGSLGLAPRSLKRAWHVVEAVTACITAATENNDGTPSPVDDLQEVTDADDEDSNALSFDRAKNYLLAWQIIHRLSQVGVLKHDKLSFDPFADTPLDDRARQICREQKGRTQTLAPQQWLALLDTAARWILDYAAPIRRICDAAKAFERERSHLRPAVFYPERKRAFQALIDEHFPHHLDRPRLLPLWHVGRSDSTDPGITLYDALGYLVGACFLLTGALTARRLGELDSLQAGCLRQDAFGEWWFSTYIEKTIRDLDELPVPASVAHAIKMLVELSASGRARTGEPWLMNIDRPGAPRNGRKESRHFLNRNLTNLLTAFAEMALSSAGLDDVAFAPHQLRRAFAIYYYHANRYGDFDALSRFLRHFDPEMTRIYITDILGGNLGRLAEVSRSFGKEADEREEQATRGAEPAAAQSTRTTANRVHQSLVDARSRVTALNEVREETGVQRMLDVHDNVEQPIGQGAARLYADLDDLVEQARKHVRLVNPRTNASPEDVREALPTVLKRYVKTHYMEPVSGGFAHCRCTPGDAADLGQAACLNRKRDETGTRGHQRPDYAYATIEDCLGLCPHGLALSENQRVVDDTLARATKAAPGRGAAIADSIVASIKSAKSAVANRGRG